MKYLFTSILGSFVFDDHLSIIDEGTEKTLSKKYPQLIPLPPKKVPPALGAFKEQKYRRQFYKKNVELTKKAVKGSVSEDQLIIQTIANIDELDKICNVLTKRLREWYGLYYPELRVGNNEKYVELVLEGKRRTAMGADLGKVHVEEMKTLANEIQRLMRLRKTHESYLKTVMEAYCPNLLELAGATIGAKLLERGKGLKHLALLPASTIQLLGAEKALFRHLKTGAKGPKFGILYHHQLVQKAKPSVRGKAARMVADKLSLCARLDYFKGGSKAKEYRKELEEKLR